MKTGRTLTVRSVPEAQESLERAARKLVNRAEWSNPYSVMGRRYLARLNDLRVPLAELRLARKLEKERSAAI